jgi:hypothetical protein
MNRSGPFGRLVVLRQGFCMNPGHGFATGLAMK